MRKKTTTPVLKPRRRVNRHIDGLRTSSMVTRWYREMHEPHAMNIEPKKVIQVLNRAEVTFILMGAHGIAGWLPQARSTQDVDILVRKSHHRKAVWAVYDAFPDLAAKDSIAVTRFYDPHTKKVVIDLMKPLEKLYTEAFSYVVPVGSTHNVPSVELALASKYAAVLSKYRDEFKKGQDLVDFTNIARHNLDRIDLEVVSRLADMIQPGAAEEILKRIDDIRTGRYRAT